MGEGPQECGKYDFKPAPTMRSFSERLIHAAYANQFFLAALSGGKMPGFDDPKRDTFKSKAEIVAYVKKSFADGAAAIKAKGDKGMSDLVVDPFANEKATVSDFGYGFVEHSGEIYGQLTVLLPNGRNGSARVATQAITFRRGG